MPYFAVTVEHDLNWDSSRGMREQDEWDAHATFMDALVDEGFVVLGGPVGDASGFCLRSGPTARKRWRLAWPRTPGGRWVC